MIERRKSMRNDGALLLAILITSGFLGIAFLVLLHGVPEESVAIAQQLISIMSMIMGAVAGYFYGASKTNTETAAALAAKVSPTTDAPIKADDVSVQASGDVTVQGKASG